MVTATAKSIERTGAPRQTRTQTLKPFAIDQVATVNGLRFQYREYAALGPQERTVVLLHGLASSSEIWSSVAPLLARGTRVVALDQRGHGRSDKPDTGYDFPSVVGDLDAFLHQLGVQRPILVGHSWGANVALEYAAAQPDRVAALVLVDGGLDELPSRAEATWEEIERDMAPPDLTHLARHELIEQVKEWEWGTFWNDQVEATVLSLFEVDERGKVRPRLSRSNHMKILRAAWEQQLTELYPRIAAPALVVPTIHTDDAEAVARKRAMVAQAETLLKDARVRWFEDTYHDVPLQRPRELAAVIESFVTERVGSAEAGRENKPLAKPFADTPLTIRA